MAGRVGEAGTYVYTATDLGSLTGLSGSNNHANLATGINNNGQVVGYVKNSSGYTDAFFVYSMNGGSMSLLTALPGTNSYNPATGINNAGLIVGASSGTPGDAFFATTGGSATDLYSDFGLTTNNGSMANGINASGAVVGYFYDSKYNGHAFLYSGGTVTDLTSSLSKSASANVQAIVSSEATGINDSGEVVGYGNTSTGYWHDYAFLYTGGTNGTAVGLGVPTGYSSTAYSAANAININGDVVGYVSYNNANSKDTHAFLYSGGTMTDLGTFSGLTGGTSAALGINESGQIVGDASNTVGGAPDAFLYTDGQMEDLTDELGSPLAGWTSTVATGINDAGDIVGYGTCNGAIQAFLLTPEEVQQQGQTPEPVSMIFFGTGLVAVGGYVARRRMLRQG